MTLTAKEAAIEFAFCRAVELGFGADIYEVLCSFDVLKALSDEEKEDIYDGLAKRVYDVYEYIEAERLVSIGDMTPDEVEQVYGQTAAYAWVNNMRQAM